MKNEYEYHILKSVQLAEFLELFAAHLGSHDDPAIMDEDFVISIFNTTCASITSMRSDIEAHTRRLPHDYSEDYHIVDLFNQNWQRVIEDMSTHLPNHPRWMLALDMEGTFVIRFIRGNSHYE